MKFDELPEFTKEFKKRAKKYKSLPQDLKEFKRVVSVVPLGNSKHFNVITKSEQCAVVKARFFCRYLKGSSLRIIYAFHCKSCRIDFIQIYFKGARVNEDRERIRNYLKSI